MQYKIEVYPYGFGYVGIVSRSDKAESLGYLEGVNIVRPRNDKDFPIYLRKKSLLRDFEKYCKKQEVVDGNKNKAPPSGEEYVYVDGVAEFNKNVTL